MIYSEALAEFVRSWEGLRLEPYLDAVGVPTIGYGHLLAPTDARPDSITIEQAERYLADDLTAHASGVDEIITVDVAAHEREALIDFAFNLGVGALARSTLLRRVNERNFFAAAEEFGRWVYAGDERMIGLVKRREAERRMFEYADYSGRP